MTPIYERLEMNPVRLHLGRLFYLFAAFQLSSWGFGLAFHFESRDDFALDFGLGPFVFGIERNFI